MKTIKFKVSAGSSIVGPFTKGEVRPVDDERADLLIEAGQAEEVKAKVPKKKPKIKVQEEGEDVPFDEPVDNDID
ncbi:MAG: hypothetical protein KAR06_00715 [Deltaproteobacteria bacterium]|nr:hypothetical protein [Deltaproteobacteria bacterium]